MILVGYLIFSLGILRAMRDYPENNSLAFEFGSSFSDILGGFDAPGTGPDYKPGKWEVFFISQIYIAVIALNCLIAILGDSFDKVQSDAKSYDML